MGGRGNLSSGWSEVWEERQSLTRAVGLWSGVPLVFLKNIQVSCSYRVVPKMLWTFPGFFYAMWSLVSVGHFQNISGHLFTWLVCRSFWWCHGLLYIMWDARGWWEYWVFKASTVSITTAFTRHQLLIDIFFSLLSMKDDIKKQNAAISKFLK